MSIKKFTFGRNWRFFIEKFIDKERINLAKKSLTDFYQVTDFKGKSFLDIGCGSGLFSVAAFQLGAKKIISFDFDKDSVFSSKKLWRNEGKPKNWLVKCGSILDRKFTGNLGRYDFVYAWGVLHHTGKLWLALENTLKLVAPEGKLYLAIYNKTNSWGIYSDGRFGSSSFWTGIKKFYSELPSFAQKIADYSVIFFLLLTYAVRLKNPLSEIQGHAKNYRGMSWLADIRDWLGGYPYEPATVEEVFNFIRSQGFVLEKIKTNNGLMNNEYLFRKQKK